MSNNASSTNAGSANTRLRNKPSKRRRPAGVIEFAVGSIVIGLAGTALTALPDTVDVGQPLSGLVASGPIGEGRSVSVQIAAVDSDQESPAETGSESVAGDGPHIDFSTLSPAEQEALLRRLVQADRIDIASALIDAAMQSRGARGMSAAAGRLMLARILAEEGREPAAISLYQTILATEPDRLDARLELARLQFIQGDNAGARANFEAARTNPALSAEAEAIIDTYIDTMRPRDPWMIDASFGLAPDTNVTQGTTASEIRFFGLPLRLSDSMRQTTGIGVFGNVAIEYAPELPLSFESGPLGGVNTDLRLGMNVGHTAYEDPKLASTVVAGHVGLRFRHQGGSTSVLAVGSGQWQGLDLSGGGLRADLAVADIGARIELERRLDARTRFDGYVDMRYRDFPQLRDRNGIRLLADGSVTYGIDERSFARVNVRFDRTTSGLPVNAYSALTVGGGYYYDFDGPFAVYLQGSATHRLFDERPFFSREERVDNRLDGAIDVTYQEPLIFGFAPVLRYGYTYNLSTVDIYRYDRHRFDIGLTRRF